MAEISTINSNNVIKIDRWPLRILSLFWGSMIPFANLFAFPALMTISAGISFSTIKLADTILILSTLTLPLVLIISCIGGLIISFLKNYDLKPWAGILIIILPLVNIVLFFVGLFM